MTMTPTQQALLDKDLELIIEANKQTNLTRIDSFEQGKLLHIEDSLAGLQEFNAAPEGSYADLGTGGGFPGIPLCIMTGCSVLLVDSVKKKMEILSQVASELGLKDKVSTYAGRIEELAQERPQTFSVLTARALTSLPSLIELASPLLVIGGRLICYKSTHVADELKAARAIEEKLGMQYLSERSLMLSDGVTQRSIIVFEKIGKRA